MQYCNNNLEQDIMGIWNRVNAKGERDVYWEGRANVSQWKLDTDRGKGWL